MKKILITMMCVIMVIAMMPAMAFADETVVEGDQQTGEAAAAEQLESTPDGTQENPYIVDSAETLATVLTGAGAPGAGNTFISITKDIDMTGKAWTAVKVDGYHGADIVTVDGNGNTIKGLSAPLFAGGFAGGSGIVIKNLTIADSNIVSTNTIGSGAFIESVDSMAEITLINCHLKDSKVTGGNGSRTGGLLGWTAGYNNVNDGPVKTYVTIEDCTVEGCTIECNGSVGGIYGHAGNNAWTYSTIENCTVKNCTLNSTDDGGWRVGVVVGTANVGQLTINNITESGNTLTQTGKTVPEGQSNLYGRFVPGTDGVLCIDGQLVANGASMVAKCGNEFYSTLADAIAECPDNGGITILGTAELAGVEGTSQVTDLRGITFIGADSSAVIKFVNYPGSTVTGTGTFSNMILKNLTVVDETFYPAENGENAWEFTYLEIGGTNAFEDVTFTDGIMVESGSSSFVDCSFEGHNNDSSEHGNGTMYGAWVSGGSASFEKCTFTGTRGFKVHEDYGSEVESVTLDNCEFNGLSEKPGIAIGTLNANTSVTIENSEFINCQAGDQNLYIYETDTDVTAFDFTESKNVVCNGTHSVEAVAKVDATYSSTGTKAHYTCKNCGTLYSDAAGTTVVTAESLVIPKLEQVYVPDPTPVTPAPSTPKDDVVTNETTNTGAAGETVVAPTTNADVSASTTTTTTETGEAKTETKIEQTTADKIVESAVANKSEEVVIDATTAPAPTTGTTTPATETTEAAVVIPTQTIETIAEQTDAAVTIKTDVAEIKLDNTAAAAIAEQAADNGTISIVAVKTDEKVVEEETATGETETVTEVHFELKVVCSERGVIGDFQGGTVTVTVPVPEDMHTEELVAVYIDAQGHYHRVTGVKNANGTFTFTTDHFSSYAVMTAEEAEKAIAEQKAKVESVKLKLRSANAKTSKGKKAIKLTVSEVTDTGIDFDGYVIYRSTKKTSGFKKIYTTKTGTYFNTSAKKGVKYYYKAKGFVTIDGEKVYTDWSLKAIRTAK